MRPKNFARLAVALGKRTYAKPATTVARSLRNAQTANIARMQQQYRNWFNGLSANQKREFARNFHQVYDPNYRNKSNLFIPAIFRNTNLMTKRPRFTLSHKILYNLNNKNMKAVFNKYGNPVNIKTLKQLIYKRNGLRPNWAPGNWNIYSRYPEYLALTQNNVVHRRNVKYRYNKFY
jgi:hypothetical protein